MYKVYASQGQGGIHIASFVSLEDAAEYVDSKAGEASFLIENEEALEEYKKQIREEDKPTAQKS
jgi:hypothetical protein